MTKRPTPRHLRAVLDRTSPRPSDHAHAWRLTHDARHWPATTRAEDRHRREARQATVTHLEDLFPTAPLPQLGGAA